MSTPIPASTSTVLAQTANEDYALETADTVETAGVCIDASGALFGRQFLFKGIIRSTEGPVAMLLGDAALADCGSSIKIDSAASFLSAGKGIVALSGGVSVINIGDFQTVLTGLDLRGNGNDVQNVTTMVSSAGRLIVTAGRGDRIANEGTMTAYDDVIVSTGRRTALTNDLTLQSSHGDGMVSTGAAATLTNHGTIDTRLAGIVSSGAGATIANSNSIDSARSAGIVSHGNDAVITNTGTIEAATYGLSSTGDDATITNFATILAAGTGIRLAGDGAILTTKAQLSGHTALLVSGDDAVVTNTNEIHGLGAHAAAIRITASGDTAFTNRAVVDATSGLVLQAGNGAEKILNTGSLQGDVRLGGGDDWFSALKGEVTGTVAGGRGNDIYVVGTALDIVERAGQGTDTVQSRYSWTLGAHCENLTLLGKGDYAATGNRLANIITGNAGDNILTGGGGADIFVFAKGFGTDTVADFTDGRDRLDFSGYAGVSRFADLSGHLHQSGDDVVIRLGFHAQLTIEDVDVADLSAADFMF